MTRPRMASCAATWTVEFVMVSRSSVQAPIGSSRRPSIACPGTAAESMSIAASTAPKTISVRSRVARSRAEISAPAIDPTATIALSSPYPPGPEWNTDRAYAARVTGRLQVNMPNTPARTVGQSTAG
jgi:hypothetical protein